MVDESVYIVTELEFVFEADKPLVGVQINEGFSEFGVISKGGTAWFAHIGGFIFGVFLIKKFQKFQVEY